MVSFDMTLKEIGIVRSSAKSRADIPLAGAGALIEIYPEFTEALEGIKETSHILITGWLHEADRTVLRARPRKVRPDLPERGVFSLRSPDRPNPLGICSTRLRKKEGNTLYVGSIDMIDGTPIVDIKPYSRRWDCVFSAKGPEFLAPGIASREEMLASLLDEAANFHGEVCVGVAIGVRIGLRAMEFFGANLREKRFKALCRGRACIADGVQAVLAATNKRFLRTAGEGEIMIVNGETGESLTIEVAKAKINEVQEALSVTDERLFSRVEPGNDRTRSALFDSFSFS